MEFIRLARIANGIATTVNTHDEEVEFAKLIADKTPGVRLMIWRVIKVLAPYARDLSIPGEPAIEEIYQN